MKRLIAITGFAVSVLILGCVEQTQVGPTQTPPPCVKTTDGQIYVLINDAGLCFRWDDLEESGLVRGWLKPDSQGSLVNYRHYVQWWNLIETRIESCKPKETYNEQRTN